MRGLTQFLARRLPAGQAARLGQHSAAEKPACGELKAENLRLWVRSGARCWPGEAVAGSSDYLIPEFTLKPLRQDPL